MKALLAAAALLFAALPSQACVGSACMQIWSTEAGGGALAIEWHFEQNKLPMGVFCVGGDCLYSTVDPGFITSGDPPPPGFFALADGTEVRIEIVALDAGPTPTPTQAAPTRCAGDCNENGEVSIDELIAAVGIALDPASDPTICAGFDPNLDGQITINELVQFVGSALDGCDVGPTPTATRPATFAEIQQAIFAPRCAITTCHDDEFESGDLNLTADDAYDELVNVPPDIESAANQGLLRVDDFDPDNSFLLIKLIGPPLGQGSRMPLVGDPLSADEIQLIRDWIAAGAPES